MPYLPEEAAVIDGLICDYLISPRLESGIRDGYRSVHEHLQSNDLTNADYQRILSAIDFLLPTRRDDPTEYRIMVSALAKTSAVLSGVIE